MSVRETKFAEVILPLALPQTFTYRVPHEWNEDIAMGQRVIVQFGKGKKQYSAIVAHVHNIPPSSYQAKYLEAILDEKPIIHPVQLNFWNWIADYYMANIGEVMVTALPGGLRLASETKVLLHPEYQNSIDNLTDDEYLVVEALEVRNVLELSEISQILNIKYVQSKIKSLIEKKAVMVEEELKQRYKPKMVDYVRLTFEANKEARLKVIFDELGNAPRQLELLMTFIQLNGRYTAQPKEVKKLEIQKLIGATSSLVNQLVQKEIFEVYKVEAGRLTSTEATSKEKLLNEYQQVAYQEIQTHFKEKSTVLLHGIT
ncbi:MAG: primosomal protein N' (replication factor Y), partial [Vicingaceae bacterium]